jgi:hypothetical protein
MKSILIMSLLLSGCGVIQRKVVANVTGWSRICVNGVSYLQFPSGVTVEVDRDGKPRPCTD